MCLGLGLHGVSQCPQELSPVSDLVSLAVSHPAASPALYSGPHHISSNIPLAFTFVFPGPLGIQGIKHLPQLS